MHRNPNGSRGSAISPRVDLLLTGAYESARSVHLLSARPEVKGGISWHCVVTLSISLDSFGVMANPRLGMLL
jgi:hypothetical protein